MQLINAYVGGGLYGAGRKVKGLSYSAAKPAPPPPTPKISDTPADNAGTSGAGMTNKSKKALGLASGARKRKRTIARPF